MRSNQCVVLCILSFVIVLTGIAVGQTSSGTISGHVVDQEVKLIAAELNRWGIASKERA